MFPLGLNDNIYQTGNVSKDPSIDIFSFFSPRKRRSRSHGKRKNGNIIRKNRQFITLSTLKDLLSNHGLHKMLSRVCSLAVTALRKLSLAADKISFYDPLYKVACIVESYAKHVLNPHIDDDIHHKRHFLKISFINKGIDFINLPSIFKNKNVLKAVPTYFKNQETPIICYKYKNPVRSIIFNYNNIVSDLELDLSTPST